MKNPFENPGKLIKNTILTTTLAVGMLGGIQDAKAGNGGGNNKSGIETLQKEHILHAVDAKQLKKILSDYEDSPSSSFDMFMDSHPDGTFTVTEAVGQTHTAAKLSAEQKLRAEKKTSRFTFSKKLSNGNVSIVLVAIDVVVGE
jgi:hypothetical protein